MTSSSAPLPHACGDCSRAFSTKRGLENHRASHRPDRVVAVPSPANASSASLLVTVSSVSPPPPSSPSAAAGQPDEPGSQDSADSAFPPSAGLESSANPALLSDDADLLPEPSPAIPSVPDDIDVSPSAEFARRFNSILSDSSPSSWSDFVECLDAYTRFAAKHVNLPPSRPEGPPRRLNPADSKAIQRLYRRNRRRAVRVITGAGSGSCDLPPEDLAAHFCPAADFTLDPSCELFHHPSAAPVPVDMDPFSPAEVWSKLSSAESTAPGPDRLTYAHWKGTDPGAVALSAIFNVCLSHRRVPDAWKESRTILIHKKGDKGIPSNWRPIALSDTVSKLFAGCLAKRLTRWCDDFDILHPSQKGFLPHDGVFENNFVLHQRLQLARRSKADLCLASLDFSNAFGSVPHGVFLRSLECAGAGAPFIGLVREMYCGASTIFSTSAGESLPQVLATGVRQGCPLSGLLFNMGIDPVLRAIAPPSSRHEVLAYADDILLLADDPARLQVLLDRASTASAAVGLSLNPAKCFSLHFSGRRPAGARDTSFHLSGAPIRCLATGDVERFLGKPIGFQFPSDPNSMPEFQAHAERILNSQLAPWQRLEALKAFFFPSLQFSMRIGEHSKTQWKTLDERIRPLVKRTLYLPSNASNGYLYGSSELGHFGIPNAAEDSDIAQIDGAFKLLTSKDPAVLELAWDDLSALVRPRVRAAPTSADLAAFLSGTAYPETTNPISSVWSKARAASSRLGVAWEIDDARNVALIHERTSICDRRKVFRSIRDSLRKARSGALFTLAHQGKTGPYIARSKDSCHFFNSGKFTRFADWRFVHRARLGLVPLNAYKHNNASAIQKRCRRCGLFDETLPHVLDHCMRYSPMYTARHNAIVARIRNAAKGRWTVLSENRPLMGSALIPDLVLTKGDSALIIDVTVPFESCEEDDAFKVARRRKEDKYAPLAELLRSRYKEVKVEAIVVGALGSWDRANDRVVKRLCSRRYAQLMRKLIVSDTIRYSRDVYTEHITGVPQRTLLSAPARLATPPSSSNVAAASPSSASSATPLPNADASSSTASSPPAAVPLAMPTASPVLPVSSPSGLSASSHVDSRTRDTSSFRPCTWPRPTDSGSRSPRTRTFSI